MKMLTPFGACWSAAAVVHYKQDHMKKMYENQTIDLESAKKHERHLLDELKYKARKNLTRLVLPEGNEERTIQAASILQEQGLASSITLIGNPLYIEKSASYIGVNLEDIYIEDPVESDLRDEYGCKLYELRRHKGISYGVAERMILEPLFWGAMMVKEGDADAMVAGAESPTAHVLKAVLSVIGTKPGIQSASSCFLMQLPETMWGENGLLLFSDCAINPNPDAEQLAEIAITAADFFSTVINREPVVALLSFSTCGSAQHKMVTKVKLATRLAQLKRPDLEIDGELQLDTALVSSIGEKKAPGSTVAGRANVLIFPDLNSGNIGYKLVERLAGAFAYGPFIQGAAKPVSDLSRGCSVNDIVNTSLFTLVQVQNQKTEIKSNIELELVTTG